MKKLVRFWLNNFTSEVLSILIGLVVYWKTGSVFTVLLVLPIYVLVKLYLYEKLISIIDDEIDATEEAKNKSLGGSLVNERQRRRIVIGATRDLRKEHDYWERRRRQFIEKVPFLGMFSK